MTFQLLGQTPLIFNAMSEKAKHELLFPSKKKNKHEKETTMKHDPLAEFRGSMYRSQDEKSPTLLYMPSTAFKKAMSSAALDIPGVAKTEIGRLCWVVGTTVPIYGVPKLRMDVVRMANMNRTPDVRTRACLDQWCAQITVEFIQPNLTATDITNLLASAGIIRGVGDFRVEKGAGTFGQFELVSADDASVKTIMREGRKAQLAAYEAPECYDEESTSLFDWYEKEVVRRDRSSKDDAATKAAKLAAKQAKENKKTGKARGDLA